MLENRAFLNFELCGNRHSIESNEVRLHRLDIEFRKHGPECNHVVEGETVEFRVNLKNNSETVLRGVEFRDPLARGLRFVQGSFRVNGRHARPEIRRDEIRFRFEHIGAHEEHVITFRVRVGEEPRRFHCECPPNERSESLLLGDEE